MNRFLTICFFLCFNALGLFGSADAFALSLTTPTGSTITVCPTLTRLPPTIIYVNVGATGANNGTSWTNAFTDLQLALAAVPTTGSTEIWVAKGTYKPTQGTDKTISFVMKPDVAMYGGFVGGETTLTDRNYKTNVTILSGDLLGNDVVTGSGSTLIFTNYTENSNRVIFNDNNGLTATAILDGFSVKGAHNTNSGGGGMRNNFSSPSIANCIFSGNKATATPGAGMFNVGSTPSISNCIFSENYTNNNGGAMYSAGSPRISNCIFSGNYAANGAGINTPNSPILINCVFTGNTASNTGGGLYTQGSPTLTNCIFIGNTAGGSGGAIRNVSGGDETLILTNCTLTGNSSGMSTLGSIVTVKNSIIWNNGTAEVANVGILPNFPVGITVFTNSIVKGLNTTASGTGTGVFDGNTDPQFVNAANPAGVDGIFGTADDGLALSLCSPAQNVGDNSFNTSTLDLAGQPRIFSTTIDLGAYELRTSPIVTQSRFYVNIAATGNNTGLDWANAFTDLQSALNYPCAANLTEIWVAKGTYKPTQGTDKTISFVMKPNVAMYGGFVGTETTLTDRNYKTNVTILSGDLLGNDVVTGSGSTLIFTNNTENSNRIINNNNNGLTATAILDGFSIKGANNTGGGGGMLNLRSSPSIANCIFSGNKATGSAGAGMFNNGSSPNISNCIFSQNYNNNNGGGMFNAGSARISNCIFSGNYAVNGAGMHNTGFSPILINCIFTGNSVFTTASGAMYNNGSSPSLTNCTLTGNSSGMFNAGDANPTIKNSIIWGNGTSEVSNLNNIPQIPISTPVYTNTIVKGLNTTASGTGTGVFNGTTDPLFVNAANPAGTDGIFGTADDGLVLRPCSPAQNVGDNADNTTTLDLAGQPRIFSTTIDLGAYELQTAPLTTSPGNVNITWTGAVSSDWNTPCNWNPAWVPTTSNDVVIIPRLSPFEAIISGTVPAIKALEMTGNVTINAGGTLNVRGNNTADRGILIVGAVLFNRGTINLESETQTAAEVSMYLQSGGTTRSSDFVNYGTININSTDAGIGVGSSIQAYIANLQNGVINITNAAEGIEVALATDILDFNNYGTLNYNGSGIGMSLQGNTLVSNFGAINLNSGTGITSTSTVSIRNQACGKIISMGLGNDFVSAGTTTNAGLVQISGALTNTGTFTNNGVLKYGSSTGTIGNGTNASVIVKDAPTPIFVYGGTFNGVVNGIFKDAAATTSAGTFTSPNGFVPDASLPSGLQTLYAKITLSGGSCSYVVPFTYCTLPIYGINLSSAAGTNTQTKCSGTAITNITYATTGATGATFSGLPTGVTGTWAADVVTIIGTPSVSGSFNYTVTLMGGCGTSVTMGTIAVNATPAAPTSPTATPSSVVPGKTTTLTASGCTGGTLIWYDNANPTVALPNNMPTITSSRTFFAQCADVNNCVSVLNSNVTVSVVLPVELLDFKGKNTEGGNLLTWQTASEINNKGFDVERSTSNGDWEALSFVKGKGQGSTYQFMDKKPLNQSYYRLRQMDNDDKETFSKVISIQIKGKSIVKIYPSITNGEITIEGAQSFEVVNTMGQVMLSEVVIQRSSFNIHHLASGLYIVRGVDTEGSLFSVKIVKE